MDDVDSLPLAAQLRAALCGFVAAAGTRRLLPTLFHVGTPGGEEISLTHERWHDAGLRADVVERALEGLSGRAAERPVPWVTRCGELVVTDVDLAWLAAAREGFGRHGLDLPGFFVMTRYGWVNLLTEESVRWSRVRPHRTRRRPA